ncbi:linker for activation of T-cells family member 1-like isoform X2 [Narcine bancroftii]|uniref:linker for activation of T-cells family member 1-like isoform X2 n=1 Tax=Narcine bancroftii TaxID=1343680 RepID=UPI003831AEF2
MESVDAVSVCWILSWFIPFWVIALVCIRCRDRVPARIPAAIDNKNVSGCPNVSSFTVIRPTNYQTPMTPNFLFIPQQTTSQRNSVEKESDSEFYPNYENTDGKDSSDEDPDLNIARNYIEVLPDDIPALGMPLPNTGDSQIDRNSCGTIAEDYENLRDQPLTDGQDGSSNYVNIEHMNEEEEVMGEEGEVEKAEEDEEEEDEDDEEEDGSDYVNSSKCVARN